MQLHLMPILLMSGPPISVTKQPLEWEGRVSDWIGMVEGVHMLWANQTALAPDSRGIVERVGQVGQVRRREASSAQVGDGV